MPFVLIHNEPSNPNYICQSTDVKPTSGMQEGLVAYETDTGKYYVFDGSTWKLYT